MAELLDHGFDLATIPPSQGRPGFSRRRNALACLHQHRRVKAAKPRHAVIHQWHVFHGIGFIHGLQGFSRLFTWLGLRAEEHQILQQTRWGQAVALGHGGVLHEHTRSHALDVEVDCNQATRQTFKEG